MTAGMSRHQSTCREDVKKIRGDKTGKEEREVSGEKKVKGRSERRGVRGQGRVFFLRGCQRKDGSGDLEVVGWM